MLRLYEDIDATVGLPIMYFDNDDEFYEFCVMPQIITSEYTRADGTKGYVADWDFTNAYKDALSKGTYFMIRDEDSQICKHGEVTYRVNTKPIENLLPYYANIKDYVDIDKPLDTYIKDQKNK